MNSKIREFLFGNYGVRFFINYNKPYNKISLRLFPDFHFIGVILIFILTIARIAQAKNEAKDPYMESSREWRARKGMLGAYDFEESGPDYSGKAYNIIYYIGVFFGIGLIIIEVVKKIC